MHQNKCFASARYPQFLGGIAHNSRCESPRNESRPSRLKSGALVDKTSSFGGLRLWHSDAQPVCVGIADFDFESPGRFFHFYTKFFRDRMNIGDLEVDERVRPGVTLVFGEEQFHRAAFDGYKGRESGPESMHGRFAESKSLVPGHGSRRILNAQYRDHFLFHVGSMANRHALFLYPLSMHFVQGVLKTGNDANYRTVPKHRSRSILLMRACRKQNRFVPIEPFLNTAIRFRLRRSSASAILQFRGHDVLRVPELARAAVCNSCERAATWWPPVRCEDRLPHHEHAHLSVAVPYQQLLSCGGPPQTSWSSRRQKQD